MTRPDATGTPVGALRPALLAWFDRERRALAWRRSPDPYAVWISEVMLQQTQVDRVEPYFERFISRFQSVDELARASLEEVLALWSGLGYYRRARHLHAAARQLVARGSLPRSASEWLELPGVGRYTAAAVASIASGEVIVAIDANVERVLSRLACIRRARTAAGRRRLEEVGREILDPQRPGDSNQALMDLGAAVCRPGVPRCEICPLAAGCAARHQGATAEYPQRQRRARRVAERRLTVIVPRDDGILLVRREDDAPLLAGLWELPWVACGPQREAEPALAEKYGGRWRLITAHGSVRHAITFRALEIEVWRGGVEASELAENRAAGWFDRVARRALGMPSWVEKSIARLPS